MTTESTIKAIDALVTGLSAVVNLVGASQTVSQIIARRVAEGGREWTDDERAQVQAELAANRAYAEEQIAKAHGGTP